MARIPARNRQMPKSFYQETRAEVGRRTDPGGLSRDEVESGLAALITAVNTPAFAPKLIAAGISTTYGPVRVQGDADLVLIGRDSSISRSPSSAIVPARDRKRRTPPAASCLPPRSARPG